MAEQRGNEIFGRPQLQDIIENQRQDNATQVITNMVLQASPLLQLLPFIDRATVDVAAGQISFPYKRRTVARVGQTRDYNRDYAAKFSGDQTDHNAVVRPFGDAFEVDRAFGTVANEYVQAQIDGMMPAVQNRVADNFVNGDRAVNNREIDGLSKITTLEGRVSSGLSFSMADQGNNLAARRNVRRLADSVDRMRDKGYNPVILGNRDASGALGMIADVLGYTGRTLDFFGRRNVQTFADAAIINVGKSTFFGDPVNDAQGRPVYPVMEDDIIPSVDVAEVAGPPVVPAHSVTDLYVVGFSAVNGVTAITVNGQNDTTPVRYTTPDNSPGVQRRHEVELLIGLAVLSADAIEKFEDVWVG